MEQVSKYCTGTRKHCVRLIRCIFSFLRSFQTRIHACLHLMYLPCIYRLAKRPANRVPFCFQTYAAICHDLCTRLHMLSTNVDTYQHKMLIRQHMTTGPQTSSASHAPQPAQTYLRTAIESRTTLLIDKDLHGYFNRCRLLSRLRGAEEW